jgi:hypothetical protein
VSYSDSTLLPDALRALVESELRTNERVTWIEQPIPGRAARAVLPILCFAVPWTAFSVFWMAMASGIGRHSTDPFQLGFAAFGLPFVAVGIGMLSSPWWAMQMARRTLYVLTDARAIILAGGWLGSTNVRSFEPSQLRNLQREQFPDGSGSLVFAEDLASDGRGHSSRRKVGFQSIPDVRGAEDRVRALASARA